MAVVLTAIWLLPFAAPQPVEANDWPQWRGPARDCTVTARSKWPDAVDESRMKAMYRIPLGPGYSGPIVTADRVFVTETVDEEKEVVRALDRITGKEIWTVSWPGAMSVPFFAAANGSWIRATPAFDGERLYVAGMLDVLVALDAGSGQQVWRLDLSKQFGTAAESFGFVCSPLVHDGVVFVQAGCGLVKLDAKTGTVIWRAFPENGGMMGGAFSSPIVATVAGKQQLVVQTRMRLCGVDMDSGAELWGVDIPSFRGMNILTPTVLHDRVFTSSYGGGAMMFDVSKTDTGFAVAETWKNNTEAYMSSPVVIDDQLYLHLRNQRFSCIDPQSGETHWRTTPFGKYWSMAVNGDRILALDERGDLLLIRADKAEYEELSRRHLGDSTAWAHIAVAGEQVFVRELDGLTVFEWK